MASLAFGVHAQVIFSEDFTAPFTPNVQGWILTNNSIPTPTTVYAGFYQGGIFTAYDGQPNDFVRVNYNSTIGTGNISNWAMTPTLNLSNGTIIEFATITEAPIYRPDRLQVRMSVGTSTVLGTGTLAVGSFTNLLLDINPNLTTNASSLVVGNTVNGYPTTWAVFTVAVSGLAAPTVGRFAFRYFVSNGGPTGIRSNNIGIDAVKVTKTSQTADPCLSITPLSCGSGSGDLLPGGPGFTGYPSPFAQKIYSYSAVVTGQHLLNVNTASSGPIDVYQGGSCGPNVWGTSLGTLNASSNSTYSLQLMAGNNYYFLLQDLDNTSSSITVSLTCPEVTGPCSLVSKLDCAAPASFTLADGPGAWNIKPGNEKIYSFTSPVTGQYTLTLENLIGNVSLYTSTVCSETGWTQLSPATAGNYLINLKSGETQYFLIDDNDQSLTTGTCSITCAGPDACAKVNYGVSKANSPVDEDIVNVSLGSLNNTSSCTEVASGQNSILKQYSNYTGIVTAPILEPGDLYLLSVTLGECGSGSCSDGGISVYIDYDNSGSFDDAENVWSQEHCTSNPIAGTTYKAIILVPFGKPEGYKRMRVIYNCDGLTAPTATYNFGETEDYCIEVRSTVTSLLSQKPFGLHVNVFPNPTLGQLNVRLEKNDNYTLHILNTLGQVILSQAADMNTNIDLKDINSGIYFLKVMDKNHTLYTTRIIKE